MDSSLCKAVNRSAIYYILFLARFNRAPLANVSSCTVLPKAKHYSLGLLGVMLALPQEFSPLHAIVDALVNKTFSFFYI